MEIRLETTIVYWGYIRIMIMEQMEATSFVFEKSGGPQDQDTLGMRLS